MTPSNFSNFVEELDRRAKAANAVEDEFRSSFTKRVRELEEARAFAFRRLNLVKSVGGAIADAKDEEEAKSKASAVFLIEVGWTGGSQSQRDVVEKFMPVAIAIWNASKPDAKPEDGEKIEVELSAFEAWFGQNREAPFLTLMQQETVELPLVEVA